MSREKTLVKNTIIYAIGNFGSKFLGFFLLPFYTIYLSTSQFGYYDMLINTINMLIPIVTFQVYDGMYRNLLDAKDEKDKEEAITNSLGIIATNTIPFLIIYLIFIQLKQFQFSYLVLIVLILTVLSNMWAQIARGLKYNLVYSISGALITFLTVLFNIFFIVVLKFKVEALFISAIIAYSLSIIYIEYKIRVFSYIRVGLISKNYKRNLLRFSVPLIPNALSWWVLNVSDRFLLSYFLGTNANGIYAVANKFSSIIIMANGIFSLAWQESSILEYKSEDRNEYYSKMFNNYMIFQFTLVIILLSITRLVFPHFVGSGFKTAYLYIPFLYIGSTFSAFSVFYGTGYLSAKDTMGAFYTSVLGAVINILINIPLIPAIGIQAASISTMLSYLIVWIYRVIQTRKYFIIHIDKVSLSILTSITLVYTLCYYYVNSISQILLLLGSLVIFTVYNKKIIMKLIGVVTKKL